MITVEQVNTTPMLTGLSATLVDACAFSKRSIEEIASASVCACDCQYIEKALVFDSDFDNDRSTFLFSLDIPTDTVILKLIKGGQEFVIDATHGVLYNESTFIGATIDWFLVQQLYGYGHYKVRAEYTSLGETTNIDSHTFSVMRFSKQLANGTVKIESYLEGSINEYINLSGQRVYQSSRIGGFLSKSTPETTHEEYQLTNREIVQIQDKLIEGYILTTHLLPSEIYNNINRNHMLANEIFLTDYNTRSLEKFTKVPVRFDEIDEFNEHRGVRLGNLIYSFKSRIQKFVKR